MRSQHRASVLAAIGFLLLIVWAGLNLYDAVRMGAACACWLSYGYAFVLLCWAVVVIRAGYSDAKALMRQQP